jgi:hypothetical protein
MIIRNSKLASFLARRRDVARPPRFSTVLRLLGEEPGERVSFESLVSTFEDRAFGALMFIFAAPNIIPLPPGTSVVLGLPLLLISAQLAIGRRTLWLPRSVAARTIARSDFKRLIGKLLPFLRRVERIMAPRLDFFFGVVGDRLIGVACFLLALVLFLPIPFGNMLPGLAVALFALALLQRDGIAALAGWIMTVASAGLLVALSGALWVAATRFVDALF